LADALAKRRGAKRAKVALARKLAVIMDRMWVDNTQIPVRHPDGGGIGDRVISTLARISHRE
jgi:hypothetical protein